MVQERLSKVQDLLDEMVEKQFVSGASFLVIRNGWEKGYFQAGLADIEGGIPITRDTIYRLYSMTKPITSAAVMALLEDGKIDLASPVAEYLPGFDRPVVIRDKCAVPAGRPVTVQDLLNMTSGYTYEGTDSEAERQMAKLFDDIKAGMHTDLPLTTMEIAERMGALPLAFEPGEEFRYGVSADILGAIVEAVSGKTFGAYLKERFFDPLGMEDTGFYVPQEKQYRLSKVYEQSADGLKLYTVDHLGISNDMKKAPAFESGGAGLVSTIDDYAKFNRMLLCNGSVAGQTILQPETVRFMSTAQINAEQARDLAGWESLPGFSYGNLMRVMVHPEYAVTMASKGEYGWDGWLGCYMTVDPAHDMTFLLMFQRVDSGITAYTRKIRNVVFSALD